MALEKMLICILKIVLTSEEISDNRTKATIAFFIKTNNNKNCFTCFIYIYDAIIFFKNLSYESGVTNVKKKKKFNCHKQSYQYHAL